MRELPPAALLHRQLDAQPPDRALLQAGDDQPHDGDRGRADQNLSAARRQGQPALPARRASADAGGHGRVLQPDPRHKPNTAGKGRLGGVPPRLIAMGIPLAQLILGAKANLGLILLPIIFLSPVPTVCLWLVTNSLAKIKEANTARPIAVCTGYGRP